MQHFGLTPSHYLHRANRRGASKHHDDELNMVGPSDCVCASPTFDFRNLQALHASDTRFLLEPPDSPAESGVSWEAADEGVEARLSRLFMWCCCWCAWWWCC